MHVYPTTDGACDDGKHWLNSEHSKYRTFGNIWSLFNDSIFYFLIHNTLRLQLNISTTHTHTHTHHGYYFQCSFCQSTTRMAMWNLFATFVHGKRTRRFNASVLLCSAPHIACKNFRGPAYIVRILKIELRGDEGIHRISFVIITLNIWVNMRYNSAYMLSGYTLPYGWQSSHTLAHQNIFDVSQFGQRTASACTSSI